MDLVQEYLEQFDEPKHAFEITEYIVKFYPSTSLRSIYVSMLERKQRFKDFGNRFWGLHTKNYSSFIRKKTPKSLHQSIREYWKKHPQATQFEVVEALTARYNLNISQVQYSMQILINKNVDLENY